MVAIEYWKNKVAVFLPLPHHHQYCINVFIVATCGGFTGGVLDGGNGGTGGTEGGNEAGDEDGDLLPPMVTIMFVCGFCFCYVVSFGLIGELLHTNPLLLPCGRDARQ